MLHRRLLWSRVVAVTFGASTLLTVIAPMAMMRFGALDAYTVAGAVAAFILSLVIRRSLNRVEVELAHWGAKLSDDGSVGWR